jgi:hypothetical protein
LGPARDNSRMVGKPEVIVGRPLPIPSGFARGV